MESDAGTIRLGKMAAIASIEENLATEDIAYKRELGEYGEGQPEPAGGKMKIMAARDVYVNQPPPTLKATPAIQSQKVGWLAKAGLAASLLAAGAAIGVGWSLPTGEPTPPPADEAPVDANTQYELRFGVE